MKAKLPYFSTITQLWAALSLSSRRPRSNAHVSPSFTLHKHHKRPSDMFDERVQVPFLVQSHYERFQSGRR